MTLPRVLYKTVPTPLAHVSYAKLGLNLLTAASAEGQ